MSRTSRTQSGDVFRLSPRFEVQLVGAQHCIAHPLHNLLLGSDVVQAVAVRVGKLGVTALDLRRDVPDAMTEVVFPSSLVDQSRPEQRNSLLDREYRLRLRSDRCQSSRDASNGRRRHVTIHAVESRASSAMLTSHRFMLLSMVSHRSGNTV